MSNHLTRAITALPGANTRGMMEADKATIALAHATVALAEQAEIANRIALIAAYAAAGFTGPETRDQLQQISAELNG